MAKEKSLKETKETLHRLQELIDHTYETKDYHNTSEISSLSNKLVEMKLRDDFLSDDLNSEEKHTLDLAIIIART